MSDILNLKLGDSVERQSQVFNLVRTPLKGSIFQLLSFSFRDKIIDANLNSEFLDMQNWVYNSITNEKMGFLLEIRIYTNEFGTPLIPNGNLINSIGIGNEPLDSLAEYKRIDRYNLKIDVQNLTNSSFYVWIVKNEGRLLAKTIDKAFYDNFNKLATEEAQKRNLLGSWIQSVPQSTFKTINIANYWIDVYNKNVKGFRTSKNIIKIENLNKEMVKLDNESNKLFKQYQEIEEKLAQQESYYSTLKKIRAITSLISNAISVQKAFCENKPIKALTDNSDEILIQKYELQQELIKNDKIIKSKIRIEVNSSIERIIESDKQLKNLYTNEGILTPNKEILEKLP